MSRGGSGRRASLLLLPASQLINKGSVPSVLWLDLQYAPESSLHLCVWKKGRLCGLGAEVVGAHLAATHTQPPLVCFLFLLFSSFLSFPYYSSLAFSSVEIQAAEPSPKDIIQTRPSDGALGGACGPSGQSETHTQSSDPWTMTFKHILGRGLLIPGFNFHVYSVARILVFLQ